MRNEPLDCPSMEHSRTFGAAGYTPGGTVDVTVSLTNRWPWTKNVFFNEFIPAGFTFNSIVSTSHALTAQPAACDHGYCSASLAVAFPSGSLGTRR